MSLAQAQAGAAMQHQEQGARHLAVGHWPQPVLLILRPGLALSCLAQVAQHFGL